MSDSNRTSLSFAQEVTLGTVPAIAFKYLPVSSMDLTQAKSTVESNTIRADRNLPGLIQTELVPQGGFGFDFIYGALDPFLAATLGGAWSTPVNLAGTAVTISGSVITAGAGTPFSVVTVGQWLGIVISGTTYLVRVTAIGGSGANITVTGATLPTGAQTLTTTKGSFVRNGTTMIGFTLEQHHQDEASLPFFTWSGMVPNQLSLSAQAQQIVTGSIQFLGQTARAPAAASLSTGPVTAADTTEGFAGLSGNIGSFLLDGAAVLPSAMAIRGVDLSIAANVRRDVAINVTQMGWGQFTVTGKLSTYFKGGMSAVDKFFSHANAAFSFAMTDPAGNILVLTLGRLKFTNFSKPVGGKNQAVMGDLDFQAILDPTYANTFQLDRIPIT